MAFFLLPSMKLFFKYLILLFGILLFSYSCKEDEDKSAKKVIVKSKHDVNKVVKKQINEILSKKINDSTVVICSTNLPTAKYLQQLHPKDLELLWTKNGKRNTLGFELFYIIKNARWYGLHPEDYHYSKLDSLTKIFYNKKDNTHDAYAIAQYELLSSDAYLQMGAHIDKGRFYPDSLLREWKTSKLQANWFEKMKEGIQTKRLRTALDSLEPKHEGYQFLKIQFRNYLYLTKNISWDSVTFTKTTDTLLFLKNLKERLLITGDFDTSVVGTDSIKLAKALKHFQKRMELDPDGKLGKFTRRALSYSKEKTIRQMEMALERWRWEPEELPKKYFWVNIPSADLHIYEKDKKGRDTVVLYSRVVVGKPETQTPQLKSKVNYMQIYPYWKVPYSIAWKEILPAVQRDTSYLRRKNFEVIDGKGNVVSPSKLRWSKFTKDYLPISFRQRIGADNSLGVVKFNFNNKHGVYLHDTNSKRYFKTFYRYQSHGCIRLEKFVETADFLIRDDTIHTNHDSIQLYLGQQVQRKVNVKKPIPIYIKYYTAAVDSAGLHFYLDIYRKDEAMMNLIYKN